MTDKQQRSEIDDVFFRAEQFRVSNKTEEALKEYTRVVYFAPGHWPAWFHLGDLFAGKGKLPLAVALLRRAEQINPNNPVIKNHIGDHLLTLGDAEDAIACWQASWKLDPTKKNTSALLKIGRHRWEANRYEDAIESFDQLISCRDGEAEKDKDADHRITVAKWFRILCLKSLGRYQEAWADYECRNDIPGVIVPKPDGQQWQGEPLEGKRLFLAYEQRFGDFIQYARFLPLLAEKGATVIVHTPPELLRQMKQAFPDIELASTSDPLPEYDYFHYFSSVPAVLNMSKQDALAAPKQYLGVDKGDREEPLPERPGTALKVGLVWAGKPEPDRSIDLGFLLPLLQHPEVSFYSLQLGDRRKDLYDHAAAWLITDLSPSIKDFYDSSILLDQMDLLITCDTAIAHQAGALGMPTWVMLRNFADWRWEVDRDDNDWYPSIRLFRQHKEGDWTEAAAQMQGAFAKWVKSAAKGTRKKAS